MHFKELTIREWQQFREVQIRFHDRVTVLTGANGSGKTTILNLLARHHDWLVPSLATPRRRSAKEAFQFFVRLFYDDSDQSQAEIGQLVYDDGQVAKLLVPQTTAPQYQVKIEGQVKVPCFYIPSHRPVYRYEQLTTIPATKQTKSTAFDRVWNSTKGRYFGSADRSAVFHMKEILIAWSIFGRGNEDMPPDDEQLSLYLQFQETLRHILPESLGFRKFSIRDMEVVMECDSGEFLIDAVSGGVSSLIDLTWQIFMYATKDGKDFSVLIDEIENHLHPTMQRRIIADLLSAFPEARFIVSTHSPLIVGSVRDSSVFVLQYNELNAIESQELDITSRPRAAAEILDEALGVSFSYPVWAENALNNVIRDFSEHTLDEEAVKALQGRLKQEGLDEFLPKALRASLLGLND